MLRPSLIRRCTVLLLTCAVTGLVQAASAPQPYGILPTTCDGLPRVDVGTASGYCMGRVFAPEAGKFSRRQVRTPRMLLQLPDQERWLLSDLGGWTAGRGALWRIRLEPSGKVQYVAIAKGLSLPHTLSYGPDGAIYLGEMHRISRVNPESGALTPVVSGLPANELHIGRHPLSHFIFDRNGDLLVNVGADSDQCEAEASKAKACRESEGTAARAALRRYRYLGAGKWDPQHAVEVRGLRNSMVLLRHASGTLLQAENSYDFAPKQPRPHEELNVLQAGAHYGWPYCYDSKEQTPAWSGHSPMRCDSAAHTPPVLLLPPHSAPLGGLYYEATLLPALRGKLLLGLHGYYRTGSRILAYTVNERGIPVGGEPLDLTPGWELRAGRRPAGAPVALTVARDGSIWIADDRNASVLRLSIDRP